MIWLSLTKASSMALAMFSFGQTLMFDLKAQQSTNLKDREQISRNSFVHLAFHSSTVARNTLFIDGGEITLLGGGERITTTQNKTLTIDLTKSWTTSEVEYGSLDKSPSVPVLNYGTLWTSPDHTSMLSFGGVRSSYPYSPRIGNIELWKYSATNGWSGLTSQSPASPSLTNNRPAAAASTYGNGIGYMLGGIRGNDNAPWWPLPGMLTYDMTKNTWTNESTASIMPYSAIGGSLTFVPGFGAEGVLIAMGGEYTGAKPWMEMATNFVPFTNVSIWDIASKTWYWQNATANTNSADIPPPATMFCSAGVAGQNGTFEIFIYGGHSDTFVLSSKTPSDADRTTQHAFNAVYVLSLPGFVWTRVDTEIAVPRTGHTCNVIGNRQMLSIGGLNPVYKLQDAQDLPDNFTQGLGIFDMVDLKWTTSYNANASRYTSPGVIQKWYNAHATRDLADWSSSGVKALFEQSTNSTTSDSNISAGPAPNVFVPTIVGAILGTVLLAGLAMLLYRRSRKRYREGHLPDAKVESGDTLAHSLRSYLAKPRKLYLAQRKSFLRQNIGNPTMPIVIVSAPGSLTNGRGSHMTQSDVCDAAGHVRHVQIPRVVAANVPETWSAAQYPDHPAFTGTRNHCVDREGQREPRSLDLPRTVHHTSPYSTNHQISSLPNIPPLNTRLNNPYQGRHQEGYRSSGSEWSMTTASTTNIQDHREFWDRSLPHSPSTIPELGTDNEYRVKPRAHHGTSFELE